MRRLACTVLLACAAALALGATPALAAGNDVIRDCTDNGRIDQTHGPADYEEALENLPSDVDEYTDCRQTIASASRSGGGSGGGGSGGGSGSSGGGGSSGSPGGDRKPGSASSARREPQGAPVVPAVPPEGVLPSEPVRQGVPAPVVAMLTLLGLSLIVWLAMVVRARAARRGRDEFR